MTDYIKIIRILTKLFKNNKQKIQNKLFIFEKIAKHIFRQFIKTFMKAFILIHFDCKNLIRIKIDISEFVIETILFQFIMFVIDVNQTQ